MENIKEIFKNISEEEFLTHKVDLHIHTACSDGEGDARQILNSAKQKEYKLIAITDHNTVEVHKNLHDSILITGAEFDCWYGYVFIHMLAYGIDIQNTEFKKFLAKNKLGTDHAVIRILSFRNVPKLIKAIHSAGGIAVLAHPACYWAINLEGMVKSLIKHGLDGIETYYPYDRFRKYVKFHSAKKILEIADKYPQLIKTGGSDFHGKLF